MATTRSSWPSTLALIRRRRRSGARHGPGIRHILFVVDDIQTSLAGRRAHGGELVNYENSYRLGYVRGPARIIVELEQKIG